MTWTESRGGGKRMPRAAFLLATVVAALVATSSALAGPIRGSDGGTGKGTFVAPGLLDLAKSTPNAKIRLIISSAGGSQGAQNAFNNASGNSNNDNQDGDHVTRKLGIVGSVSVELKAKKIAKLALLPGLTITRDEPAHLSSLGLPPAPPPPPPPAPSFTATQLWPTVSGNVSLWSAVDALISASMPTIAIIDSGIDANRADFAGRVVADVNLATAMPQSPGDGRGHGTFVAGIAAGAAPGYAGAAPGAKIASIRVMNDNGMAWTSDVVAAAQWVLDHRIQYGIRVANFSLTTDQTVPFYADPLDQAVEQLWLHGVTVVAAAGNYGTAEGPSGVRYAPGDDPFVITVGAADINGTLSTADDFIAWWSAYGYTMDGFAKPELSAPGRYMVGPVPPNSTLPLERPDQVPAPGYMQLSGTSFAAPVVSGTVAHILALHPEYTPDQVKGALMLTAHGLPSVTSLATGVGELDASAAANMVNPPNPNQALYSFVTTDPLTGAASFNQATWNATVQTSASWNSASWNSASWNSASWNSASWNSASWNSASWNSGTLAAASWNSASWNSAALESATSDFNPAGPYLLSPP